MQDILRMQVRLKGSNIAASEAFEDVWDSSGSTR